MKFCYFYLEVFGFQMRQRVELTVLHLDQHFRYDSFQARKGRNSELMRR